MKKLAAAIVFVVSLSAVPATPAVAEEYTCRGTVGAETLDNVRVPDGRTCVLEGTYVKGTIKVETGATLRAKGVRVIGNVQAEDAANVVVKARSGIGGSVQVVQGGKASVIRSRVNGDILYDDNNRALSAIRNKIGGNLQAFQNTGGVEIRHNRIDGNLQCKENRPAPTGGNNIVEGSKEDQCERL